MKKSGRKITKILAITGAFLLIIILAFLAFRHSLGQTWKTYQHQDVLSIRYPSKWTIVEPGKTSLEYPYQRVFLLFMITNTPQNSLNDKKIQENSRIIVRQLPWLTQEYFESSTNIPDVENYEILLQEERFKIDNQPTIRNVLIFPKEIKENRQKLLFYRINTGKYIFEVTGIIPSSHKPFLVRLYEELLLRATIRSLKFSNLPPIKLPTWTEEFYPTIKEKLEMVKGQLGGQILEINDYSLKWISPDGLNIANYNTPAIEYNFNCSIKDSLTSTLKTTEAIRPQIDEIMNQNGFKPNQKNLAEPLEYTSGEYLSYIRAYEKGETKCVFEANPNNCSFFFGCTKEYTRNYQEQSQYIKDLGIKGQFMSIANKKGDFAVIHVYFRWSGHAILAKKTDGKWKEIDSGQDIPECKLIQKYQVPKEVISNCWDKDTKQIEKNTF